VVGVTESLYRTCHTDSRSIRSEHLKEGESIIYQSPILTRAGIFLPKRRTLVLTSAARLLCVKEDAVKGRIKIESECLVTNPLRLTAIDEKSEVENKKARDSSAIRGKVVKNVQAKGPRAFQVQTVSDDVSSGAIGNRQSDSSTIRIIPFWRIGRIFGHDG
jgi:hypothetical protein